MFKKYWIEKTEMSKGKRLDTIEVVKLSELKEEKNKTNEIIFDMLNQCCGNEESTVIDNRCMSCYEDACDYLTKEGWLKEINSRMYKVIKKQLGD